jgi:hypothetical protein
MAFNNDRPYQSTYLFEQTLIQNRIPFDIIFDAQLKNLSKYKVLILADQECLTDESLSLIRDYVKNGGGLVATEFTSLYTQWHERKSEFGLNDLFKITPPDWNGRMLPESVLSIPVQRNHFGKGNVVYIPEIKPSVVKPDAEAMTSQYWKLPVNWKVLAESVNWTSDNKLSLYTEAPLNVTIELVQKEDNSKMILHLLNYDFRNSSVKNIKVDLLEPEGKKVREVKVLTPDGRIDEILRFESIGKRIVFTVPLLSIYNVIVMKLE